MTEKFEGVDLTPAAEVNRVLVAAMSEELSRVFMVGTKTNGDLFVAGSGDENEALLDIAEFLSAIAKGKFQ